MSDINQQSMLPIGTVVGGRYRIVRYLSSGGFGNTYEAEHTDLGNRCAIKEYFVDGMTHRGHNGLSVEVSNTQNLNIYNSQLEKFRQEAQLLNKMQHPGIVRVHDLFIDNDTAYYAMDIINGESLAAIMKKNGPLPEKKALAYIGQVLDALAYVHSKGLLHLDIKPGNIMIDRATDRAILIDFGATKQFDRSSTGFSSTAPAFTKGYAPPEQINYNKVKIGPWTDLYALGATLFTLTTGEFPPLSDDITDYEDAAFRFAADATPAFRQLVVWLMQQPTKRRPQSVPEVQQFLSPKEPGQKPKPEDPVPTEAEETEKAKFQGKPSSVSHPEEKPKAGVSYRLRLRVSFLYNRWRASFVLIGEIVLALLMLTLSHPFTMYDSPFRTFSFGAIFVNLITLNEFSRVSFGLVFSCLDFDGILLAWVYSFASLICLILLFLYMEKISVKKWRLITAIFTIACCVNSCLLPIWNYSLTGAYFILSLGLSLISAFTILIKKNN